MGRKHDQFLWERQHKLFHRNNSNYSAQLSLSINDRTFRSESTPEKNQGQQIVPAILQSPFENNPALMIGNYADFSVPWNLSLNYTLSYVSTYMAQLCHYQHNVIQTLSISGNFDLTKNWKVAFSTGYDFANHGMSYTSIDIYRDLHCWEMRFNWVPFGYYKSWNFSINIKASALKDLKYEKRRSYQDNHGYYSY